MDSDQELGTERFGDPKRCGCSPQSALSAHQYPQGPTVFTPNCPDRESDPANSDSAGTKASSAPPSCLRWRRKHCRLRMRFQAPPLQCCSHRKNRLFPRVRRSVRRLMATKTRVELVEREPSTSSGGSQQRNPGAGWTASWPRLGMKEISGSG